MKDFTPERILTLVILALVVLLLLSLVFGWPVAELQLEQ